MLENGQGRSRALVKLSWKLHLERVAAQAFRTSILLVYGSTQVRVKQNVRQKMEPVCALAGGVFIATAVVGWFILCEVRRRS